MEGCVWMLLARALLNYILSVSLRPFLTLGLKPCKLNFSISLANFLLGQSMVSPRGDLEGRLGGGRVDS